MEKTPLSMRKHVALFGETNAGKSALFNALLGQELAIVSEKKGTTTDPVIKAMELVPFGAIALIDTAGLGDNTTLGKSRMKKTQGILRRCDLALYTADICNFDAEKYREFTKLSPSTILVFTKTDLAQSDNVKLKQEYKEAVFVSVNAPESIDRLKTVMAERLSRIQTDDTPVIAQLLPSGSVIVLVVPIDSEAPKGRLILPQVQLIRECLDSGIKAFVTRETELESALSELRRVDLVVTDSQVFGFVDKIVSADIPLTSFSMLLAKQKGNFSQLLKGARQIDKLENGANILVLEGCTHNSTHEDIGRVKIPALIRKKTGKQLNFNYYAGYDIPKDFSKYQLVIMCGGCMLNQKEITSRLLLCKENDIPVTNYGMILAHLNGILDRASKIFTERE